MKTSTPRAIAARYAMSPQDEAAAVQLAQRAGEQLDDSHWMLVGGTRSLAGSLGRLLERRVFAAEYGGHGHAMMVAEYGPYEDRTVHAAIVDSQGVIAAARTITSTSATEPTKLESDLRLDKDELRQHHCVTDRYGTATLFELATAVVEPRARGGIVTGWLLGEMRRQQMHIDPAAPSCAMIDRSFNRMIKIWGHEMSDACDLQPLSYMGHLCQPTFFEPGPQLQVGESRLYRALSDGWLDRVRKPVVTSESIDLSELPATSI